MAKGDIISRLRLESGEFDSKIKRASQELLAYSEHCRKTGIQMGFANKDAKDFALSLGGMATVSTTARGKVAELTEALTNMKVMYKNLTDAEKQGQFGRNLAASLDQMKARLDAAKKDLSDVQTELSGSKFGQFGNVIDGIGKKMGVGANLTGLLTSKTALMSAGIGAATAIVSKAASEWAKYNSELARQDQVTQVVTGLKGQRANNMTDSMRAVSDTYGVDFREAINAANTLMSQFGKTGDEAIKLIQDGMQGMIMGDGGKLLSMIQQYAPAFRDAGVSADQLVAVIHNSEGGIFTDQNMNAIVMGIKNIRLMTNATSDALGKLGIDGKKMSQELSDGTLTVFGALKRVATAIQGVDSGSQAAGAVMQQVFGRQGAMAGTKLGEAIATLNLNLEETKKQTGKVGESFRELQDASTDLNRAIREAFSYDGWDAMTNDIKAKLLSVLATVVDKLGVIRRMVFGLNNRDIMRQLNGGDNGNPTKTDQQIETLKGGSSQILRWGIYRGQVKAYNAEIEKARLGQEALEKWNSGAPKDDETRKAVSQVWAEYKTTDASYMEKLANGLTVMRDEYMARAKEFIRPKGSPESADNQEKSIDPQKNTGANPVEQARKSVSAALGKYEDSIALATKEYEKGTISEAEYKRQLLQGQRQLYDAYGQAYRTYADPKYKDAQQKAADEIVRLGDEVKTATKAQKAVEESARKLEQTQKELSTATADAATAQKRNDLKSYYQAQNKIKLNGGDVSVPTGFTASESNVNAFIQHIEDQITKEDPGSALYQNLTSRLKDARAIQVIIEEAVRNGVPMLKDFDVQALWKTVFTENGDIPNETWRSILESINKHLLEGGFKPIKLTAIMDYDIDGNDKGQGGNGDIDENQSDKEGKKKKKGKSNKNEDEDKDNKNNKKDRIDWKAAIQLTEEISGKLISGVGSISSGLQQLGVELPKGLQNILSGIQGMTSILTGISSLVSIITVLQEFKSVPVIGQFAASGGVIKNFSAGGMVPGVSYTGDRLRLPVNGGRGMIGVNSGELILSKSSQDNLADSIRAAESLAGMIGMQSNYLSRYEQSSPAEMLMAEPHGGVAGGTPYVTGETIMLGANNHLRRTGQGEIVTTNMLRRMGLI